MINVAIVEDQEKIRSRLAALLAFANNFKCVGEYPSAEAALESIPMLQPQIVLMDINLPGMNGIECTRALRESNPELLVVMLTVYEDTERIFQSLQAGAVGYLLKHTKPDELLNALRDVAAGGSPMSAQIARKVVQSFQSKTEERTDPLADLTPRENQILDLLSKGYLYKEIAAEFSISPDTVHNHLRKIYEKLQVRSRTEAVVKYLKR